MFTYTKIKNFKSLLDFNFDFSRTDSNLILIYGENGVGKSNLSAAFLALSEFMRTMEMRDVIQSLLLQFKDRSREEAIDKLIRSHFRDTQSIIDSNKTISIDGNMVLEFGFSLESKKGVYIIEANNEEIVHERLEFTLSKNKGLYYDLTPQEKKINESIFIDKLYYQEVLGNIEKFWGKHSLLAILNYDRIDKARNYLDKRISMSFLAVMNEFISLTCKVKNGSSGELGVLGYKHRVLTNLESGEIQKAQESELDQSEQILNLCLCQSVKDITGVYYKRKYSDEKIRYELYIKKRMFGQIVDVAFDLESTGIQSMVEILPFLAAAIHGATVIIDEIDTGISGRASQSVADEIKDLSQYHQIIVITHQPIIAAKADKQKPAKAERQKAAKADGEQLSERGGPEAGNGVSGPDHPDRGTCRRDFYGTGAGLRGNAGSRAGMDR